MRITVFGSTSRIGHHLLAEGARRGLEIVASTRRPDALAGPTPAAVIKGDARDPNTVRRAIEGSDAVVAIIAGGNRKDPHQAADASRTIVAGMTELGVRRLVVTSAYPIVATKPRLLIALLRFVLATTYADGAAMEGIVSSSDLDWTIVRLNRLTDGPVTGKIHTSPELLASPRAHSRADAAITLLDIVQQGIAVRTAMNVSGA